MIIAFHLSDEQYYREHVSDIRHTAELTANTAARRPLLDLAEEYEEIADNVWRSRFRGGSELVPGPLG